MNKTKAPTPPSTPDDPEQSKRFIEAAREAQADETEAGAERAFKKVVGAKRATLEPPGKRK